MIRRHVAAVVIVCTALTPAVASATSTIFRSAFTEVTAANATGIVTGDFDNDGAIDVVTCNAGSGGNELNVLGGFNNGTILSAARIPIGSLPSGMLLADFDRDEIPDLIVALGNDNAVTFLKGRADGDFFDPPTATSPAGTGPVAMVTADLDGDGDGDLVVANEGIESGHGSVSIFHGNGDGTFTVIPQADPTNPDQTVDELPAGSGTRAIAIGNIDGDPALDIVALNTRATELHSLTIFSGAGGGLFTPRGDIATGAGPQDLALVDLNGDGHLDLVTAESNEDAVAVRFGHGDRTFASPVSYHTGTAPSRLALADLDDNGTLDIVASNTRSGDVTLLRGDGMGGFAGARTYVAEAEPQALTVADLDADGLLEPVAATQGGAGGPSVAVLRNRGDGVLQAVEDLATGNAPAAVATADVTDDGLADLLVTGNAGIAVILPALAAGGFAAPVTIDVGGRGVGLVAVDLNGDGQPDIAVADNENNRVAVALASGPGRFDPAQHYPVADGPSAIASGDFNHDGHPDLAVTAIGPPARVSVLLQNAGGTGTFATARSTVLADQVTPVGLATVDANCDGRDDLVVANQASQTVSVLRSRGDGLFDLVQTLPGTAVGQGPTAIVAADFDRDGTTDFAVGDLRAPLNSPSIRTFAGDCGAGQFSARGTLRAGDLVNALVARDFTGDGIVDIGLVNQTANGVRVASGKGDGTFNNPFPADPVSRMPVDIAAGDVDGDGRYDAATANSDPSANNVSVLYNCARDPGCDPFRPGPPGSAALRGDGNRDGIRSAADLVAVAAEVADGDGQQVEAITRGSFGGTRASSGVDANGDGIVTSQDRRAVAHRIFGGA